MTRLLILCLCLPAPALACLWDRDTLAMETRRFPGAAKLIAGHFLQRSQAYFEWRLKDRRARIEKDPDDLAAYDDLAVALDKLGRPAEAIALMVEKETRKPGLYETAANRGTFHIHAGQFEEGLVHLRRALEINPDAHFGRERYQVWLVEYVQSRKGAQPLGAAVDHGKGFGAVEQGFAEFLANKGEATKRAVAGKIVLTPEARRKALKGVLGMLRFGRADSPVLLEVAGHILSTNPFGIKQDAKRLAARAFLRASQVAPEAQKAGYRALAQAVLRTQLDRKTGKPLAIEVVEAALAKDRAKAEAYVARIAADEAKWIAAGQDPDARFDRKYLPKKRKKKRK